MKTELVKVHLVNVRVLGQRCGFGEGITHDAAITDALRIARLSDPNAAYNPNQRVVEFDGGTVCL